MKKFAFGFAAGIVTVGASLAGLMVWADRSDPTYNGTYPNY